MSDTLKYNGEFKNDFQQAGHLGGLLVSFLNKEVVKVKGEIIHSEVLLDDIVATLLDKYSGIDAVMKSKNDISGLALRIQSHSNRNWGTFTVRYKRHTGTETEYSKRMRQIYKGHPSFFPHYTCQAYYDNKNTLLGGAICSTKNLFDVIKESQPFSRDGRVYIQTNQSDKNTFLVIPFEEVPKVFIF